MTEKQANLINYRIHDIRHGFMDTLGPAAGYAYGSVLLNIAGDLLLHPSSAHEMIENIFRENWVPLIHNIEQWIKLGRIFHIDDEDQARTLTDTFLARGFLGKREVIISPQGQALRMHVKEYADEMPWG